MMVSTYAELTIVENYTVTGSIIIVEIELFEQRKMIL